MSIPIQYYKGMLCIIMAMMIAGMIAAKVLKAFIVTRILLIITIIGMVLITEITIIIMRIKIILILRMIIATIKHQEQ